jgi:peptide alpha-N-acetyltransferase
MSFQKHYESKQYKKGVKTAESILKKYPNHGGMNHLNARV